MATNESLYGEEDYKGVGNDMLDPNTFDVMAAGRPSQNSSVSGLDDKTMFSLKMRSSAESSKM